MRRSALLLGLCLLLATGAAAGDPDAAAADPAPTPSLDARPRFADQLSTYEPMYFSLGFRDHTDARFQLSFQYAFVNPSGDLATWGRTARYLSFGYTQTTVWDLSAPSAPFFDTSYRPTLFWSREAVARSDRRHRQLDLQAGVEHESNGQGGDASRSLNIAYVAPTLRLATGGDLEWTIAPRIYDYIGDLSDNPDIAEYRGYLDLRLAVRQRNGLKAAATLRKGTRGGRGSLQLDLSFPMDRLLSGSFSAFLHLQYFNGWGETLRTYDQRLPSRIRLGFMIVR